MIYALIFDENRSIYVGKTINPRSRKSSHVSISGGWDKPFRYVLLECVLRTWRREDLTREQVWRAIAQQHGWAVYRHAPGVLYPNRKDVASDTDYHNDFYSWLWPCHRELTHCPGRQATWNDVVESQMGQKIGGYHILKEIDKHPGVSWIRNNPYQHLN